MPTFEELLQEPNKARIFSSFDAKDGFYQVGLDQECSKLTTFWTPLGRHCHLRMPFGISLAPEVFESRLQKCLADLLGVKVIRDVLLLVMVKPTRKHFLIMIRMWFAYLNEPNKSIWSSTRTKLRQAEVKYIGHVISRDGLKPEDDKVTAIKNTLKLTTRSEVLTLLVFVNYLSKFLPKLSDVSTSLRELTTDHSKFTCAKQHDEAFATIQRLVIQYPVLKLYTFTSRTLTNRTKICNQRERMSGNSFCLWKIQSISSTFFSKASE